MGFFPLDKVAVPLLLLANNILLAALEGDSFFCLLSSGLMALFIPYIVASGVLYKIIIIVILSSPFGV